MFELVWRLRVKVWLLEESIRDKEYEKLINLMYYRLQDNGVMQEGGGFSSVQEFSLLKFNHSFEFWVPMQ